MRRAGSLRMLVMVVGMVSFNAGTVFGQLAPRTPLPKRPYQLMPDRPHRMVVKFADAMRARCNQQGQLTAQHQGMLNQVNQVVQQHSLLFTRLIQMPYPQLTNLEQRAAARSNKAQPDLGGMMVVHFPQSANELQVANDLKNLNAVEFCVSEGLDEEFPGDIAPTTPLLEAEQDFRGPDPGMDIEYAWSKTPLGTTYNARGKGITLTDVEGDWNADHEDLVDQTITFLNTPDPDTGEAQLAAWHGTSTLGVTSAVENAYGCTGLVPDAAVQVASTFPTPTQDFATPTTLAIHYSDPGDVIMLELQGALVGFPEPPPPPPSDCPVSGGGPVEIFEPMWMLTRLAVDTDIVVVAAAGNYSVDLDAEPQDPQNPTDWEAALEAWRDRGDSGAIIVGAGSADTGHAWCFSTFGTRVNLQGWGEQVFTLGCAGVEEAECIEFASENQDYNIYTGTSSATPQVTGAVVSLQGFAGDRFHAPLTPEHMRELLIETGHAQGGVDPEDHHIGPYPNLRAAIDTLLDDPSVALPFDDSFPSTTIDDAKWPIATGVIDTLGDGEPSAPNSMHLGPGQSFETASIVTTGACTAGSIIQATLEFSWQSGGMLTVPNGNLIIRYRDDSDPGVWRPLRVITPSVPAPFDEETVSLVDVNGLHDAFRLRFESEATLGEWFIDDVHFDIVTIPEFRLTPFTPNVCEGDEVSFDIEAVGGGTLTYQWERDGTAIGGATGITYSIASAVAADSGDYTVVATNVCGATESTPGELTVDVPVGLTVTGPAGPVSCGAEAILAVAVTGSPSPALQWLLDDTPIDGATGTTFTISSVCPGDEGVYKVVTANSQACGGQTVESNELSLEVDEAGQACGDCPPVIMSAVSIRSHAGVPLPIAVDRDVQTGEVFTTETRDGEVQRLDIRFNQAMDPTTAELSGNYSIVGHTGGPIGETDILADLDPSGFTVTLTFPGLPGDALPDQDCYTITLSTAILNVDDEPLEGDRDFVLRVLMGDVNQDGTIDPLDFGYIQARFSLPVNDPANTSADVNVDGAINPLDIGTAQSNFPLSATCP